MGRTAGTDKVGFARMERSSELRLLDHRRRNPAEGTRILNRPDRATPRDFESCRSSASQSPWNDYSEV